MRGRIKERGRGRVKLYGFRTHVPNLCQGFRVQTFIKDLLSVLVTKTNGS